MPSRHRTANALIVDILILLLSACLLVIEGRGDIEYRSGLTNCAMEKGLPMGTLFLHAILCLTVLSCIVILIGRLAYHWRTTPRLVRTIRVGILFIIYSGCVLAIGLQVPGIERFAQGFEKKMRYDADVGAIRLWAAGLTIYGDGDRVPATVWPKCITVLRPRDVYYVEDGNAVRVTWGGGFLGNYGLAVGPTSMNVPPTTTVERIVPFEAGAYLFFPRG